MRRHQAFALAPTLNLEVSHAVMLDLGSSAFPRLPYSQDLTADELRGELRRVGER